MTIKNACGIAVVTALLSSAYTQAFAGEPSSWTGFYAGVGAGYGGFLLNEKDFDPSATPPLQFTVNVLDHPQLIASFDKILQVPETADTVP